MDFNSQKQTAGDGAQQNQGNVVIVNNYNGISAEELSAVLLKQGLFVREQCTEIANQIVDEKLKEFDKRLMSVFTKDKSLMNSYKKPAFQILTREAQLSAIVSERDTDLDLLTQLLVCHVKKGKDLKTRSAIHQATKIVSEIDNDALCGLTVAHAFINFTPTSNVCKKGLETMNTLFSKLIYLNLPEGNAWLDQLDILGAVRIMPPFYQKIDIVSRYRKIMKGYMCIGINKDSEEYHKAVYLLEAVGLNKEYLIPNECLDGYVKLPIGNEEEIDKTLHTLDSRFVSTNHEQKKAFKQIFEMYSKDPFLRNRVQEGFINIWNSFDFLRQFKLWWDGIPQSFEITSVGRVLAHTNAKRCDPNLPDLI